MSPSFDGTVWALAASGTTVFAGGSFTGANGGTTRNHLAAVDATTGAVTAWDANVDDVVYGLALSGPTQYAVGDFAHVNGNTILRGDAAAFDTTTGIATAWNPRAGGVTCAVAVDGDKVYVGGNFDRVNDSNTVRHGLACVDADLDTGRATNWAPQLGSQDPGPATSVSVNASSVYAGGSFTAARTGTPHRLAAWDATTGASMGFDPDVNDTVNAIAVSGSTVWTATALQFSVAVDWGDGTASSQGTVTGGNGPFTVTASHTYASQGTYPIVVAIVDLTSTTNLAFVPSTVNVGEAHRVDRDVLPDPPAERPAAPPEPPPPSPRPTVPAH